MTTIDDILAYNANFVEEREYEQYITDKYPDKKLAIVSCMDTRLTALLPAALGLANGDAKIIQNAGGVISHPFGSVMRSLLLAVLKLGVNTIMIIGHTNCGMAKMDADTAIQLMLDAGIPQDHIDTMRYCGIDFEEWFAGLGDATQSVRNSVEMVANHPLMPDYVTVRGFIINSVTGALTPIDE